MDRNRRQDDTEPTPTPLAPAPRTLREALDGMHSINPASAAILADMAKVPWPPLAPRGSSYRGGGRR